MSKTFHINSREGENSLFDLWALRITKNRHQDQLFFSINSMFHLSKQESKGEKNIWHPINGCKRHFVSNKIRD